MAINLKLNDDGSADIDAPDPEPQDTGGDTSSTLQDINDMVQQADELIGNINQLMNNLNGHQPQAPPRQAPENSGEPTDSHGDAPAQSAGGGGILETAEPEELVGMLEDGVVFMTEELEDGMDATMADLQEYLVENRDAIMQLVARYQAQQAVQETQQGQAGEPASLPGEPA